MKLWKVILAVVAIFGAGLATGLILAPRRGASAPRNAAAFPPGLPGAGAWRQGRAQFVQRLNRELNLTARQSADLERIMRESHERLEKLWEPIAPEAHAETRKVREQIQAILTPEQKTKFEKVIKRRPREMRERDDRKENSRPRKERQELRTNNPAGSSNQTRLNAD